MENIADLCAWRFKNLLFTLPADLCWIVQTYLIRSHLWQWTRFFFVSCMCRLIHCLFGWFLSLCIRTTSYNLQLYSKSKSKSKLTRDQGVFSHDLPTEFYDSCTLITYFGLRFFSSFLFAYFGIYAIVCLCEWHDVWKWVKSSAAILICAFHVYLSPVSRFARKRRKNYSTLLCHKLWTICCSIVLRKWLGK